MATETLPTGRRGPAARGRTAPRRAPLAADGRAVRRRAAVPVPLLLHADRLAAGRAEHRPERAAAQPGQPTLHNYSQIDDAIYLGRTLVNSGIFTGGVLLCTVVFGLLAGYALAVLEFRGKGAVFASVMLILVVPFQLLTVPLYVLIVRDYGLADSYLGMILPFAINSTAVFVFRQFFLQLPQGAVRGGADRRRGRAHDPAGGSRSRCASRRC